jgi:uncharacterized protein DUF4154
MVAVARPRLPSLLLCLGATIMVAGGRAHADEARSDRLSEYQVKAAYLYYFTTFVSWPPETFSGTGDTLIVGVLGEDPFGAILDDTLRGKTVDNRRFVVKRFGNIKDARESHILFISASERDRLPTILKVLEGAAVLTVGDLGQFASRGSQIAFRMEDKKVRFDINVAAVEHARLKVSAQLMKLGRIVEAAGRQGG